jgi:ribose transport system ATP-binding protein
MTIALEIHHLSKTFPGQQALVDVALQVQSGEVHALVGQNGSGKSTLIKILAGYHQPDPGSDATVSGKPFQLGNGSAAFTAGIRFVHQDLGLVTTLSTIENLALVNGYQTGFAGRINWQSEATRASGAMATLGFVDFDVKTPVGDLAPAQRTAVAIARALVGWENGATLLVLDEPTASLAADDKSRLFDVVKRLKAKGVSILYVTHHLEEVFELADQVTVLRDARRVVTAPVRELNYDTLVEAIVGHRVDVGTASVPKASGEAVATVRGLSGGNLRGLDLDIHPGEIVGLAGITGSGREDVVALISGQTVRKNGTVTVGGKDVPNFDPAAAKLCGVANVPADRSIRATIGPFSVRENMTVTDLGRFVKGRRLRYRAERAETASWIEKLSVRLSGPEALIGSLSGGNQQKIMFARALRMSPKLMLLDEPTQGVDIGAKDQIHALVDEAAATGAATIVSSSDTTELVRLASRVLVFVEGGVIAELSGPEISVEHINHLQLQSSRRPS